MIEFYAKRVFLRFFVEFVFQTIELLHGEADVFGGTRFLGSYSRLFASS